MQALRYLICSIPPDGIGFGPSIRTLQVHDSGGYSTKICKKSGFDISKHVPSEATVTKARRATSGKQGWQSWHSGAFEDNREYILPVRLDDVELPGLLPTDGYLDLRKISVGRLIELIRDKVRMH